MAEMTKKLHFLKNGTEQTAKAYSTVDEVGSIYIPSKIDGVACYIPVGSVSDTMATNGRVIKGGTTYAILATGTPPYAKKQWTTAGTYTFTVPARVTRIRATCVGGGGAGTARHTNANTANGEDSSFGSVVAKGGNSCRLNGNTVVQYPYGGSPNGRSGGLWSRGGAFTATDAAGNKYQVNDTTKDVYRAGGKGFALSTSKADGDYGRGGQVYNWDYYCTYGSGGSGGWNQQTISVTPNTTITVKVGARANYASGDADGVNASESNQARGGFVIIEYGQGV